MTERKRQPTKRKPTTEEMLARFKGRSRKGRPNRLTAMLKEAMLEAPAIKGMTATVLVGSPAGC